MVVETKLSTLNAIKPRKPFNLPLAGMVVETDRVWVVEPEQKPFNLPLAGMVVETYFSDIKSQFFTNFQPTPGWYGC